MLENCASVKKITLYIKIRYFYENHRPFTPVKKIQLTGIQAETSSSVMVNLLTVNSVLVQN